MPPLLWSFPGGRISKSSHPVRYRNKYSICFQSVQVNDFFAQPLIFLITERPPAGQPAGGISDPPMSKSRAAGFASGSALSSARGGYHSGQATLSHSLTGNGKKRQSRGFIVGNRKPVLCIPPQVPISSALPGSWAIMFLYCFIIFHRHFLNWCKIRCKLTYPDLPLKINKAGHFSFLRSFIVNIHCCRDIRMPHDFLNNLEIFLVLAKASAKCMP